MSAPAAAPARRLSRVADVGRALRNRNYRIYAAGTGVSLVGTWIQRVAVGWLTWELTESTAWLGIIAFADLLPSVVAAPLAGAFADRFDKLRLTIATQILALVQAVLLAVLTFTGLITIGWLLALTIFLGIVGGFSQTVRLSLIPSLVRREDISAATAFNSVLFNAARFIGPALAGVVIVSAGVAPAFAINSVTFLALLAALALLRVPREAPAPTARPGFLGGIFDGFGYAIRHPGIAPILVVVAVTATFARPFGELLPGFAAEVFGRGADGLAWLTAATGLGAMLAGMWLAQRPAVAGLTRMVVANIVLFSAALLAFVATDLFWLGVASVVVAGFAMVICAVGSLTLIQVAVDGSMRGRVLSLYGLVFRGGMALGALLIGLLSAHVGLRLPVAGGALLCLLLFAWALPRLHRLARELEKE